MNDINYELINFWSVLKAMPQALYAAISSIPGTEEQYYRHRAIQPNRLGPLNRAARFAFLNRNAFNGLYRTNQKGEFNVPFGGRRNGSLPTETQFCAASLRVQNTTFECSDFEDFVDRTTRPGDFVYLDPPYVVGGSRVSGGYDVNSFSKKDHIRLIQVLHRLDKRGIAFLLSYVPDNDLATQLSKYFRGSYQVRRRISGFKSGRVVTLELAFTNY